MIRQRSLQNGRQGFSGAYGASAPQRGQGTVFTGQNVRLKLPAKPAPARSFDFNMFSGYSRSYSGSPCWAVSPRPEHRPQSAGELAGTIISGGADGRRNPSARAVSTADGVGRLPAGVCCLSGQCFCPSRTLSVSGSTRDSGHHSRFVQSFLLLATAAPVLGVDGAFLLEAGPSR